MEKNCISCGMPLKKETDFPMGDRRKDHCVHCAQEDGSLKTFDQALTGMIPFIMQVKGLAEPEARQAAIEHLTKMPAWKNQAGK